MDKSKLRFNEVLFEVMEEWQDDVMPAIQRIRNAKNMEEVAFIDWSIVNEGLSNINEKFFDLFIEEFPKKG